MKKLWKHLLIYFCIALCLFYLLPWIGTAAGSSLSFILVTLLLINPLFCLASGIIFSLTAGFSLYLPLLLGLSFLPSVFLFYNETALLYALLYFGLALLGICAGPLFRRR